MYFSPDRPVHSPTQMRRFLSTVDNYKHGVEMELRMKKKGIEIFSRDGSR